MASNYSVHAIPIYWILAIVPHVYATQTIKKANNGKYNNANPRSTSTLASYQKSVPAEVYGRYERAQAAHKNMLENAPFFIGAVIVGNVVGLDPNTLNTAVGAYLALRIAYIGAYINVKSLKYSFVRSLLWVLSTVLLISVYWKSGNKLLAQG